MERIEEYTKLKIREAIKRERITISDRGKLAHCVNVKCKDCAMYKSDLGAKGVNCDLLINDLADRIINFINANMDEILYQFGKEN